MRLNPNKGENSSARRPLDPYSLRRRDLASETGEDECEHTTDGRYCQKYARFHCPGLRNCDNIDDYLESLPRRL